MNRTQVVKDDSLIKRGQVFSAVKNVEALNSEQHRALTNIISTRIMKIKEVVLLKHVIANRLGTPMLPGSKVFFRDKKKFQLVAFKSQYHDQLDDDKLFYDLWSSEKCRCV